MFDEPLGDRFPNEEQRLVRRADLFKELSTFLDDYRESDGGWPEVTMADKHALSDIFGEILDLKYGRDCDGDRAVAYSINSKKSGVPVSFVLPHFETNNDDDDKFFAWLSRNTYVARLASSYAETAMKNIDFATSDRERFQAAKRDRQFTYNSLPEQIVALQYFDEAEELMVATYDHARKYNEENLLVHAQKVMAQRFSEQLQGVIDAAMGVMSEFSSDQDEDFYKRVAEPRARMAKVFGNAFTRHTDITERSQYLREKGAAIRKQAKAERNAK